MKKILDKDAAHILGARNRLDSLSQNFDIRRMAAVTNADVDTFYILCGWMSENDVRSFQKDIENDNKVFCVVGEDQHDPNTIPPTKLKNPKLFKPYEMYIQMYGLPNYHEFDPTIFVAITYSFIFGAMFGDAGQGLCLLIGGLFLYLKKHMPLAGIIASAGVFSTFFGVMFGSFFGFEDVIPAVWLRPTDAMNTKRFVRCFWGLDKALAYARHYPAINWMESYSEYVTDLAPWYKENVDRKFVEDRMQIVAILHSEDKLMETVKLIGSDVLPDDQKLTLEIARVIRLGFLQQNAFHPEDANVPLKKQFLMMETILYLNQKAKELVTMGHPMSILKEEDIFEKVIAIKYDVPNSKLEMFDDYHRMIDDFYNKVLEKNG